MRGRGFRLERLLRIVQIRESHYLLQLAVTRRAEAEAHARLEEAGEARTRLVSAMREAADCIDPLPMTLGWAAMDQAEARVAAATSRWQERHLLTLQSRRELTEAARGRKSLEHLRKKHLVRQQFEWNREEHRQTDEHATVRRASREAEDRCR